MQTLTQGIIEHMSDFDGRVPPADGLKQLTPAQKTILDEIVGLIYALSRRESSLERITITVKNGLPRTISHTHVQQRMPETADDLIGGALKWLNSIQLNDIDEAVHDACKESEREGGWIEIPLEIVNGHLVSIGPPTISREFKPI